MILARPIRRTEYLFGRYLGIVLAFAAFMVASVVLGLLVKTVWGPRGPIAPLDLLGGIGFGTLWAAQMAAAIVFFSTFLPGYGDVIALLVLQIFISRRTNVALDGQGDRSDRAAKSCPPSHGRTCSAESPTSRRRRAALVLAVTLSFVRGRRRVFPEGVRLWARLTAARRRRDPSRRSRPCSCGSCSPRSCCGW